MSIPKITVSTRTVHTHSDEKFNYYDVYLVFTDYNGKQIVDTKVAAWGVPSGNAPLEDSGIDSLRNAVQTAIDSALREFNP